VVATTPLVALTQLPLAVWLRTNAYAYPILETIHILGLGTLLGSLLIVDLRLLGVRAFGLANFPALALSKAVLPWTLLGFCIAAVTGLTMFFARAGDLIGNRAFVIKIVLLCVVGANAALLHSRGGLSAPSGFTRTQALLSMVMWIAIVACGRMIAYV
jgi:hypothetical protein